MCGIHAVLSKRSIALASLGNYMEQGFIVNTLRGTDSTGVFQVDRQHKLYTTKQMVPGHTFVETKVAKRFMADVPSSIITVGHVRAATHGKVTTDNAHPFSADRPDGTGIIGVHNGTISNWRAHKDSAAYDVDSEWAINLIAKEGVDALEQMQGSYCFMWYDDKTPSKLYVVRNEHRPMHFLFTKDRDAALFASEAGMIAWLAERNHIECSDMIYSLEPDKLYTFDMDKIGTEITFTKTNAPKYVPKSYTTNYHNGTNNRGGWNPQKGAWDTNYRPGTGYSANGVDARGGSVETSKSFPAAGVYFCERFKKAIGENRNDRFAANVASKDDGVGAGESQLSSSGSKSSSTSEAKIRSSVKLSKRERRKLRAQERSTGKTYESSTRAEMNPHGDYILPPAWYSTSNATNVEINSAKSQGIMGQLSTFIGIAYEPQTGELWGEVEDYLPGQGKVKYTAVVRGLSARAAANIIEKKCIWGAVIGQFDDYVAKERVFVIAELTDIGVEGMKKTAA